MKSSHLYILVATSHQSDSTDFRTHRVRLLVDKSCVLGESVCMCASVSSCVCEFATMRNIFLCVLKTDDIASERYTDLFTCMDLTADMQPD